MRPFYVLSHWDWNCWSNFLLQLISTLTQGEPDSGRDRQVLEWQFLSHISDSVWTWSPGFPHLMHALFLQGHWGGGGGRGGLKLEIPPSPFSPSPSPSSSLPLYFNFRMGLQLNSAHCSGCSFVKCKGQPAIFNSLSVCLSVCLSLSLSLSLSSLPPSLPPSLPLSLEHNSLSIDGRVHRFWNRYRSLWRRKSGSYRSASCYQWLMLNTHRCACYRR